MVSEQLRLLDFWGEHLWVGCKEPAGGVQRGSDSCSARCVGRGSGALFRRTKGQSLTLGSQKVPSSHTQTGTDTSTHASAHTNTLTNVQPICHTHTQAAYTAPLSLSTLPYPPNTDVPTHAHRLVVAHFCQPMTRKWGKVKGGAPHPRPPLVSFPTPAAACAARRHANVSHRSTPSSQRCPWGNVEV